MGYRLADRVLDISRDMDVAVDISCGRGFVTRHLTHIKKLYVTEMSPSTLSQCQMPDPEQVTLRPNHVLNCSEAKQILNEHT